MEGGSLLRQVIRVENLAKLMLRRLLGLRPKLFQLVQDPGTSSPEWQMDLIFGIKSGQLVVSLWSTVLRRTQVIQGFNFMMRSSDLNF